MGRLALIARLVVTPGPDGTQPAVPANLVPLEKAPGVVAHSGPYPYLSMTLHANGYAVAAEVEGRDQTSSAVDRPLLTAGSWVRPGQVVLERSFAAALGVGTGDTITLNGRSFLVSGIAVSTAIPAYPPAWWLAAVVVATPLVVGALTIVPSRVAARGGAAPVLQAEAA